MPEALVSRLESPLLSAVDAPSGSTRAERSHRVTNAELWTARQRQMHPIHYTVSYRGSFKPELPEFFIARYLAKPGLVLDPFGGRGTTAIQANLMGHRAIHNDLSRVSVFLARSRQVIPSVEEAAALVEKLDLKSGPLPTAAEKKRLYPFFHPDTLRELIALKSILQKAKDPGLHYVGVTALSRLHGHSDGFFSVYSFPQISILPSAQERNNLRRGQAPEYRNVKERILRKIRRDLSEPLPEEFRRAAALNRYINGDSRKLTGVKSGSVDLIVTSPPFLDKVDYVTDNWMRAWFLGVEEDVEGAGLSILSSLEDWTSFMRDVLLEMLRVLRPGGRAVIEVGDVRARGGQVNLEEALYGLLPLSSRFGRLEIDEVLINEQKFTKLSNCWDVSNNSKGTNTNRCLIVQKVS
jgi:SAM-dependent methyltransferase